MTFGAFRSQDQGRILGEEVDILIRGIWRVGYLVEVFEKLNYGRVDAVIRGILGFVGAIHCYERLYRRALATAVKRKRNAQSLKQGL